jgi:hypothetical protein
VIDWALGEPLARIIVKRDGVEGALDQQAARVLRQVPDLELEALSIPQSFRPFDQGSIHRLQIIVGDTWHPKQPDQSEHTGEFR